MVYHHNFRHSRTFHGYTPFPHTHIHWFGHVPTVDFGKPKIHQFPGMRLLTNLGRRQIAFSSAGFFKGGPMLWKRPIGSRWFIASILSSQSCKLYNYIFLFFFICMFCNSRDSPWQLVNSSGPHMTTVDSRSFSLSSHIVADRSRFAHGVQHATSAAAPMDSPIGLVLASASGLLTGWQWDVDVISQSATRGQGWNRPLRSMCWESRNPTLLRFLHFWNG